MKYLCLAHYDEERFDALSESELDAVVSQCPSHDEALRESGQLIIQASLPPTRLTRTVRPKNGKPFITDSPFAETKEQVGGFFIIEARDMDEAVLIASKHPAAHLGEHVGWGIEVRPIERLMQL